MAFKDTIKQVWQKKIFGVPAPLVIGGGAVIAYLGYRYYKNKGQTTNNPQSTGTVVPAGTSVGQAGNPVVPDYSGELSQLTTGLSTLQGNLVGLNSGLQGLQGQIDALKTGSTSGGGQQTAAPAASGLPNLTGLSAAELAALNPFNSAQSQAQQYAQYEQQYKPVAQQPVNIAPPVQQSFMSAPFPNEPIYPGVSNAYPNVQQIYNPYTNAYFGVGSILNAPNPYGPTAAPQVIQNYGAGPIQSSTFGSGSKSFTVPGYYVGNPNQGGAIFTPGY